MGVRLVRSLTQVADEVVNSLISEQLVTKKKLNQYRKNAKNSSYSFPSGTMTDIADLYVDYEVQRDVIHKHVLNICKNWDPRICSPASAVRLVDPKNNTPVGHITTYDGQHRLIASHILGFDKVPVSLVETTDPSFASYAFEKLNATGIKKLNKSDLHRNALVREKLGSREQRNVLARTLQNQFDTLEIDLEDKNTRKSPTLCGDNDYFFSHFDYAYKAMDLDVTGNTLYEILNAIKTVFPMQEEIDQGVFIGLFELRRLASEQAIAPLLDKDWMEKLLRSVKAVIKNSSMVHKKAKQQWVWHNGDGFPWTAPIAMACFLREVHEHHGGTLVLPKHNGGKSSIGILEGNICPGLFS